MPARGKRVASRQAQLNRRRRRQARSAEDASSPVSGGGEDAVSSATVSATISAPVREAEPEVGAAEAVDGAGSRRNPARTRSSSTPEGSRAQPLNRSDQGLAYRHLASEVRRILILAGVVTVGLIGVSFLV